MSFNFKGNAPKKTGGGFNFGGKGVKDPLEDVEYTGNLPADSAKEMSALQEGFRQRAQAEQDRFRKATDSEFWFAVCFKSREDKEAFLKAANAKKNLMGDKYLDGYKLAKLLGLEM